MADDDLELSELDYLRDRALRSMPHGQPSSRRRGNHFVRSRDRHRDFARASSSSPSSHSYSTSTSSLRSRSTLSSRSRTPSCSPSRSYSSSISSSYTSLSTPDSNSYTPPSNRYHHRSPTPPYRVSRAPRHRRLSDESPSYAYTSLPRREREKLSHTLPRRGPRSPPLRDDRGRLNRHPLPPPSRDSRIPYSDRVKDRHRYSDEYHPRPPSPPPLSPLRSRLKPSRNRSPVPYRSSLPPPPPPGRRSDRDYRGEPPPELRLRRDRRSPAALPVRSRIGRPREPHESRDHNFRSSRHDPPPPPPPPPRHDRRPLSPLPPRHPRDRLRPPPHSPREGVRLRPRSPREVVRLRPRSPRESGRLPPRPRSPRESGRLPPRPRSPRHSSRLPSRPRSPRESGRLSPRPHSPRGSGRLPPLPRSPRESGRLPPRHRSPRESRHLSPRTRSPRERRRPLHPSREHERVERTERIVRKVVRHDHDDSLSPDVQHHLPPRESPAEYDHSLDRVRKSGDDRKRAENRRRPRVKDSTKRRPAEVSREGTERRKRQLVKNSTSEDERLRPPKQARKDSVESISPSPEGEEVLTGPDDPQHQEEEDELANISVSNVLEGATLDEELDYDETMETADLHLLEIEDAVEGSPGANKDSVGDGSNDEADSKEHAVLEETVEEKIKDESDSVEVEEGEMKEDELEEGEEVEEGEAIDDEEENEEGLLRSEGSLVDEDTADMIPDKDHSITSSSDEMPEPLPSSKPGVVISSPIRVSPERERRRRSSYHSSDEPRQERDAPPSGKLPVKERLFLSKKDLEHKKRTSNYHQEHRLSSKLASRLGPSPFRRRGDGVSSSQRSSWHGSRKSSKRDAVAIAEAYRREKRKKELMQHEEEVRKGRRMAKLLNKVHDPPPHRERRERRPRSVRSEGKNGMRHGKENDLDRRISKIREKNVAILKRKHEVEKDKRLYS